MNGTELTALRIDHMSEPLAIDDPHPSFRWQMRTGRRGARQIAYRMIVRSGSRLFWDSGRIESACSAGIRYPEEAIPLERETVYDWLLTVWDEHNEPVFANTRFSTGLMSRSLEEWHGAQWIGPDEISFSAETLPVFRFNFRMQIREGGSSAGVVFGASDPRLNVSIHNNYLICGENYIAYRLNVSTIPATVEVSRKGYAPGEDRETVVEVMKVPTEVIREDNRYEEHRFEIVVSGNQMEVMTVDGHALETEKENLRMVSSPLKKVTERTHLVLNPLKAVMDVPVYPRLCQIGFVTDAETTAVFTEYSVRHYGGEQNEIFSARTGATWAVFSGKPGVSVGQDRITAASGTLCYSDPSYGSIPMFRKSFSLDRDISSAKVYAAARGIYELTLNGQKVGKEYLANGDMDFSSRILYAAYDVTSLLQNGENVLSAQVASGWYGDQTSYTLENYNWYGDRQSLLALLAVTFSDGTVEYIPTGSDWQYYGEGPVRYAGNFNGELYDATREAAIEGWNLPGFSAQEWRRAVQISPLVLGREPLVQAKPDPGIFHTETLAASFAGAETRGKDQAKVYLYDMGVNMVGIPEIVFPRGEKGRQVTIRYGEVLYPCLARDNPYYYGDLGGLILTENLRSALVTDRYVMKGETNEIFRPVFTFHGYRYVEISGLDEPIPAGNIRGIVLSSIQPAARYQSSDPHTNQLFSNIIRSTVSNHLSIPTDCPQRDERLGWAGDAQVFSETAVYLADLSAFYGFYNLLQRDAQGGDGTFHLFAPPYSEPGVAFSLGYTWNAAGVVIPWQTYLQYGDRKVLEENYPSIRRHIKGMMNRKAQGYNFLTSQIGFLGDHLALTDTDPMLMDNAQFYRSVCIARTMSELLGEAADAEEFNTYACGLQAEWNAVFLNSEHRTRSEDGTVQDTQASYALPLMCGVFSAENRPYAHRFLNEACVKAGYRMTTGFMGTGPLLPALTLGGDSETAYRLFEQTDCPSWLYPVLNGATSVWERWNSFTVENGFAGQNGMNSFNHYSLGAVASWMLEYQAGIQRDGMSGFRSFILQPTPGGHFTSLCASYDSIYGTITSEWEAKDGGMTRYRAVVPANTAATLYLPVSEEKAERFRNTEGAVFRGMAVHNGRMCAVFALAAGEYEFIL